MMYELKIGMDLFHKNSFDVVRTCKLIDIYFDQGYEKLSVKLNEKVTIVSENRETDIFTGILSRSIGQVLFFTKEDTELTISELAQKDEYIKFGNLSILFERNRIEREIEETNRKNEIEKKKKERAIERLTEILETRKINNLIYFTKIENLESILKYGIVPEAYHLKLNISSKMNHAIKREYFQFFGNGYSIEFPNYRLLNRFRSDGKLSDRYVILRLDAKSLLIDTIDKQNYCVDNALTNSKKYSDVDDFDKLFMNKYYKEEYEFEGTIQSGFDVERGDLKIPDCYPTNPQAEIVICDIVHPRYIKEVVFECEYDKQLWLENNHALHEGLINVVVDDALFGPRSDYEFWQTSYQ